MSTATAAIKIFGSRDGDYELPEVLRKICGAQIPQDTGGPITGEAVRITGSLLPLPLGVSWLSSIQRRITDSILPEEYGHAETGEWLKERAGIAAKEFFDAYANLLPNEPYIYASRKGDLVAEFETPHGNLTAIVSEKSHHSLCRSFESRQSVGAGST